MRAVVASSVAGLVFALGLGVAGMTKPAKVLGFLDLFGAWDASLAFVMVGAIAVYAVAFRAVRGRAAPLFDDRFHLPTRKDLDLRLVLGAALFGVGWGLAGYCPGPGLVAAATGSPGGLAFVLGLALGTKAEHALARILARPRGVTPPSGAPAR